ncbi:GDSL-type esterase/lipase family protein [Azospirillum doebereinerae]|uniref:GDSL-type esterase/lipase family protein n=1 Tax=Azospirillum doebereinerae TaxID=92933 RepID=UPI00163B7CFF|nr:GDSL-type esterase/lipase family protein [Azospirillum doebereinerae]
MINFLHTGRPAHGSASACAAGKLAGLPAGLWAVAAVALFAALPAHAADRPSGSRTPPVAEKGHGQDTGRLAGGQRGLATFMAALTKLERAPRGTVQILQIGDSHTAGNHFSGALRTLLQGRFGDAGPGGFPPGPSYKGLYSPTVTLGPQSWTVSGGLEVKSGDIVGFSGFQATSAQPGNALSFESKGDAPVTAVSLTLAAGPAGGTLLVEADGKPVRSVPTKGPRETGVVVPVPLAQPARTITLSPKGDGRVTLLRVSLKGGNKGILYESHGVIGATATLMRRWHEPTVAAELQALRPELIILAFGTNEGFNASLSADDYRTAFRERLAVLRRQAPWASILVIGPPDANRLPKGCPPEATASCASVRPQSGSCAWYPPPELATVRTIQRSEALSAGAAFWDWSAVMGGACGTHDWGKATPALAAPDHVHFRAEGYRMAAEALFNDIMELHQAPPPARGKPGPIRLPDCRGTVYLNGSIQCLR